MYDDIKFESCNTSIQKPYKEPYQIKKQPGCLPVCGSDLKKKTRASFVPSDSKVLKEGDLMKIGQRTGLMISRFFILRDSSLYIYKNREQPIPSCVIPLRGLYISQIKQDKVSQYFGLSISHESKDVKTIILYHRNHEAIQDWVRCLKIEASNLSFDELYTIGKKIGKGKFSQVFECQNKETQEVVAMKLISKPSLSEREREFLREEIQIVKLISHPYIVEIKETYETEKYMFIIMEQVSGGELFEHIKHAELKEREI